MHKIAAVLMAGLISSPAWAAGPREAVAAFRAVLRRHAGCGAQFRCRSVTWLAGEVAYLCPDSHVMANASPNWKPTHG